MDILSVQGLLAMLQIIVIDILLAGDNAIVIGMAARNLPAHLQKKAIFWGTAGAIILRLVMAFLFVEALNNIPALRLIGGILLLWIGYKLVADDESEHNIEAKDNLRAAITTIVIADGIMGIDNVIGVVGAAGTNHHLWQYFICESHRTLPNYPIRWRRYPWLGRCWYGSRGYIDCS